jgi:hypothetical protein
MGGSCSAFRAADPVPFSAIARPGLVILAFAALAGCTNAEGTLLLERGYRGPDDPCRTVGAFFTNVPGDASPDLVACPPGTPPPPAGRVWPLGPQDGQDTYYLVP